MKIDGLKQIDKVVPWNEHVMSVAGVFACRNCLLAAERYRAINNIPKYAHLCTMCWEQDPNKEHFVQVLISGL